MSKAAFSVKVFAVYLAGLGVTLLFVPNLLLGLFGFAATAEVWIRVLGVVVINLGVYYWFAAVSESVPFFRASVATRVFVLVAFTALVVAGLAQSTLILFGAVDALGGLWTHLALRAGKRRA